MKSNITLIGMPGAGKSTVGIILAKNLGMGFIDTDVLIQMRERRTLQQIMDACGHLGLRAVEECEILDLRVENHVIATGGSAAYSPAAMAHLGRLSTIVFLQAAFDEIKRRIHNFETRGIAKDRNQSFEALFDERQALYRQYAEVTIDCSRLDQEQAAMQIAAALPTDKRRGILPGSSV